MKINVIIEGQTFAATLEDNKTANVFLQMLPLTIKMDDVNSNEKYAVLPSVIKNETASKIGSIQAGDIMCYGEAGLVLFYETFPTSYSYVPIGHIDDTEGLLEVLGSGDIDVQFSGQINDN